MMALGKEMDIDRCSISPPAPITAAVAITNSSAAALLDLRRRKSRRRPIATTTTAASSSPSARPSGRTITPLSPP